MDVYVVMFQERAAGGMSLIGVGVNRDAADDLVQARVVGSVEWRSEGEGRWVAFDPENWGNEYVMTQTPVHDRISTKP
jgi:hypothetical protein